jgi:hypothetical protein
MPNKKSNATKTFNKNHVPILAVNSTFIQDRDNKKTITIGRDLSLPVHSLGYSHSPQEPAFQQQQGPTIVSTARGTNHCINSNRDQPLHQQQQGPTIVSTATWTNHCINSNRDQPLYQQQQGSTIVSTATGTKHCINSNRDQPLYQQQ